MASGTVRAGDEAAARRTEQTVGRIFVRDAGLASVRRGERDGAPALGKRIGSIGIR